MARNYHQKSAVSGRGEARSFHEQIRAHQLQVLPEDLRAFQETLQKAAAADAFQTQPFLLLTRNGIILHLNATAATLLAEPPDAIRLRPVSDFVRDDDLRGLFKFFTLCASSSETLRAEFSLRRHPGNSKPVVFCVRMLTGPRGRVVFAVSVFDPDVPGVGGLPGPARWNDEASLIGAIDGVIWRATLPFRLTYVSDYCTKLLGISSQEWLSDPRFWESHIVGEDRERVVQARQQAARKQAAHELTYRMVCNDGRVVWVRDRAVLAHAESGKPVFTGTMTDVTELQNAREELRRTNASLEQAVHDRTQKLQQSLTAMQTFSYGIAHDLSAPMRSIEGFTGMLLNEYAENFDERARDYADRVSKAVNHLAAMVQALLAYGRLSAVPSEFLPVNVGHIMQSVVVALAADIREKDAIIRTQSRYPQVLGNPALVEQALTNLIANALKFRHPAERTEITVAAAEPEPADRARVVRIVVTDNGIGIAPEDQEKIFDVFQRLHRKEQYPGTGIGLAIVKRAVELMNGRVGVFSRANEGSSFWIELPAA